MAYIPEAALARLYSYSYKGVDKSVLSRYVLNPFWTWFVTLWPLWIAPNTITLLGLCMVLVNFASMLYFDPNFLVEKGDGAAAAATVQGGVPHWLYYTWAVGLFVYQSFDAIDGKQARRTGMAGPLGEMFDHGCDAINTTLEVILAAHALNLGRSWWTVTSQIATLANFYLTTWEEYHTGQLYLGVFSGPVEGILMIVGIFVISGWYGPKVWDTPFLTFTRLDRVELIAKHVPNIGLNELFMVFGAFALGFNIITSYTNVFKAHRASGRSVLRPLLYLLPFPTTVLLQLAWLHAPGERIRNSPLLVPFLCAWGLQFAHQVGRMILAHVTSGGRDRDSSSNNGGGGEGGRRDANGDVVGNVEGAKGFPWWNWMWVWFALGAADANAERLFGREPFFQASYISTRIFVYLTLAITFFYYERFVTLVISEITNYLGIACFTVRKKDARGNWKSAKEVNGVATAANKPKQI